MKSLTVRNYFFPSAEIESAVGSLMFFLHSFYIFFVNKYLQDNLIDRKLLSHSALSLDFHLVQYSTKIKIIRS